jgi:hypothetical protein
MSASSKARVIFGLARAEVAKARSNRVYVLAAIKGDPPAGIKRRLTARTRSVSTRVSRFSVDAR